MSEENTVLFSAENSIATITLNRPKSLNAMNEALVNALIAALERARLDDEIRVVILTGAGRAFGAGGDLAHLSALTCAADAKKFIDKVGSLVERIARLPKPVIAMVNGVAAGAAFNLALAADIVCCASSARFAQSFAKVGLVPDCGGMYLLPRAVGLHKAKELMFTADMILAADAEKLGIVNHIFPDEQLRQATCALAKKLAAAAPLALAMMKETLNAADTMTLPELLAKESAQQTLCMQTEDHREGLAAFKEKRAPQFCGR